jgi:2-polyprenyl-3-methyl-5-hydroxy-6-metoxy-1,4-benzoquinol methylase
MVELTQASLEKLREHFNAAPYPSRPLEVMPIQPDFLYKHSLIAAVYRRDRRVIETRGKVILDAGCGTGYKSLALAQANPGAKIIGVDLSEDSVDLARQRMAFWGLENCAFHAMAIEDLSCLGLEYDYINCDDVLYLVPDPIAGLKAMAAVLAPEGIMRVNYHSVTGRDRFQLGQQAFGMLGMMAGAPCRDEVELVRQTIQAMRSDVSLRARTWSNKYLEADEYILANYLLRGDKSWSVQDFFAAMAAADLSFISMLDWLTWDLASLFEHGWEDLPMEVVFALSEMSEAAQLHFFETVHDHHRLLDLWCGRSDQPANPVKPIEDWTQSDWQNVTVHFHPQALSQGLIEEMQNCAAASMMLNLAALPELIDGGLKHATFFLDSLTVGCLLPLLDGPQPLERLKQRWLQLRPLNPLTMQTSQPEEADRPLQAILAELERIGYVMLESGAV